MPDPIGPLTAVEDHPGWTEASPGVVTAFAKAYRRTRRRTVARLHARTHTLTVGDHAVVAGAGRGHLVITDPTDVFDVDEWQVAVEDTVRPAVTAAVSAAAVDVAQNALDDAGPDIAAVVDRHVGEIASWGTSMAASTASAVEAGLRSGASVDQIVADVVGNLTDARALLVARTEAIRASNAGRLEGWRSTGDFPTKVWVSCDDDKTRDSHWEAHGLEVPLDEPFLVGGFEADYPGDPNLPDEELINCRCWLVTGTGVDLTDTGDAPVTVDQPDQSDDENPDAVTASAATDVPTASSSVTEMSRKGIMVGERSSPVPTITVPRPARFADAPPAAPTAEPDETPADETVEDQVPGDQPTGAMIAVYPDDSAALAVDGGEDPAELHVTIEYLGDAAALPDGAAEVIGTAVQEIAAAYQPLALTASAVTEFGADGPNPALVLLMQGIDLVDIADCIEEALEEAGIQTPDTYPVFFPHVTVAYAPTPDQYAAAKALIGTTVTFSQIGVAIAGEVHAYPFVGTDTDADPADAIEDADPAEMTGTGHGDNTFAGSGTDQFQVEDLPAALADLADVEMADTGDMPDVGTEARWQGVLIIEGSPSGDKRFVDEGALTWRDLPLPLMWMDRNPDGGDGHAGASLVGRIDAVWRDGTNIMGAGTFDLGSNSGWEAYRQVRSGMIRGVSADLDEVTVEFENALPEGASLDDLMGFDPGLLKITVGRVMGATICPFPAFQEAYVALVDEPDNALAASAGPALAGAQARVWTPFTEAAVVASAGAGPDQPPAEWFEPQHLTSPTPVRVSDAGQITGHVAQWGTCHIGMNRCVTPDEMRSAAAYRYFRTGQTLTAEGTLVSTGPIVVDTVHPNLRLAASDAQAFYHDTGAAVGDVVVYEDEHGIAVAGAMRSDVTAAQVRKLRGGDVSPDWRRIAGRLEIVAMLAVNNSGYKVIEALAASAGAAPEMNFQVRAEVDLTTGQVLAMVAAGGIVADQAPPVADAAATLAEQVSALAAEVAVLRRAVRPFRVERARAAALAFKGKKAPPFGKPEPDPDAAGEKDKRKAKA